MTKKKSQAKKTYQYLTKAVRMLDGARKHFRARAQAKLDKTIVNAQILIHAGGVSENKTAVSEALKTKAAKWNLPLSEEPEAWPAERKKSPHSHIAPQPVRGFLPFYLSC